MEVGLDDCFVAYLPKPNAIIDDQPFQDWRGLSHVYPSQADNLLDKSNLQ
jgi:hypothetical protein